MAAGLWAVLTKSPSQDLEVFIEPVIGVLWGLTFTGAILFLWPLACATQEWVLAARRQT